MMQKTKQVIKILIGYESGRAVTVFPDDILIVSYPKSGNTWTRFLIANLLFPQEPITFANISDKIPDIYQSKERELLHIPRPRILKSHEYFDPRYQRIIYIVRDPRDIAISFYHHKIKFGVFNENYSIERFVIEQFIKGNFNTFGDWGENVGSWLGAKKDNSNFLLLRYEDMLSNPKTELKKIAHHLKISVTNEFFDKAIKQSSFEHMQLLEKYQGLLLKKVVKNVRKDNFFVRSGQSGQWQHELSTHSVKKIESTWSQIMMQLGYL